MEVSGEAADLVMKEGVQISEEAIKLLGAGRKESRGAFVCAGKRPEEALRHGRDEPPFERTAPH